MRPRGEEEGGMKTACSRGIRGVEGAGQVCRAPGESGRGLGRWSNSWRLEAATMDRLATYVSIRGPQMIPKNNNMGAFVQGGALVEFLKPTTY